jgi:hypothetical protein
MSEENKEITGFVAWHPDGRRGGFESEQEATWTAQCFEFNALPESDRTAVIEKGNREINKFIKGLTIPGWRIRPCKIVFTDEEKEV